MKNKVMKIIISVSIIAIIIVAIVCGMSWKNNISDYDWIEKAIYTHDDGTVVDLYYKKSGLYSKRYVIENSKDYIYCDDKLILIEDPITNFPNSHTNSFDNTTLSKSANEIILNHYDNVGLLYDINEELESAFLDDDYGSKDSYNHISQQTNSVASNNNYVFVQSRLERYGNVESYKKLHSIYEYFGIKIWNINTGTLTDFKKSLN